MYQSRESNQWFLTMKVHIKMDAQLRPRETLINDRCWTLCSAKSSRSHSIAGPGGCTRAFSKLSVPLPSTTECTQDALRAWMASSGLLAITRLAKPNRLNNWAVFFARPL